MHELISDLWNMVLKSAFGNINLWPLKKFLQHKTQLIRFSPLGPFSYQMAQMYEV